MKSNKKEYAQRDVVVLDEEHNQILEEKKLHPERFKIVDDDNDGSGE